MSKLRSVPDRVPSEYNKATWTDIIRAICNQSDAHAEGRLVGRYQAQSSVPSSVAAAVGDVVWHSNPTVVGSVAPGVAASYVLLGWICTVESPTNATWKEMRVLVGT